ncbi:SGNH/GDSL hydrolase family protein [Propionibacteriaceae bacterium Y1685]|uniref:SGNH/GDSL hydrolase family protein n=1 Tax=Microlunatus sp. Y1700 TaxID=3418487 RepID=UPI003B7DF94E
MAAIRDAWQSSDELDILVLGDESGSGETGWVRQFAELASQDRPVVYLEWDSASSDYDKAELGATGGARTNIYNVSLRDGTASKASQAKKAYGDSSPDIVILSFGNHEDRTRVADSYDELVASLPGSPLVVALLQNPHADEGMQRENARAIKGWGKNSQTPVMDVFAAFVNADKPLDELLTDGGEIPNQVGARLWADYIIEQLGKE